MFLFFLLFDRDTISGHFSPVSTQQYGFRIRIGFLQYIHFESSQETLHLPIQGILLFFSCVILGNPREHSGSLSTTPINRPPGCTRGRRVPRGDRNAVRKGRRGYWWGEDSSETFQAHWGPDAKKGIWVWESLWPANRSTFAIWRRGSSPDFAIRWVSTFEFIFELKWKNEIDLLIVLPNLTYGLSVYGTYELHLNTIQNCVNRCYKRRYISVPLNVKDIMQAQDKKLCNKARALSHHPLNEILPKPKPQQYN